VMVQERISVGKIVATHGIQGEVKVIPWTDFPQRFRPGTRLFIQQGDSICNATVAGARSQGRHLIIKLNEFNDASHAGALCGAVLKVEPWEIEPLPEGHYYHFQLVGSRVLTVKGEFLGNLIDILTTGANDVYVVRDETGKEILIPALRTIVHQIDLARREIRVEVPPGLLD